MIKIIKSNKTISILLFLICIIFILNPSIYAKSCLNAISIWSFNVLPVMLPFFIITKMMINIIEVKPNFMDKFFCKTYHTPNGSFIVYLLSIISGYPVGAKLICAMYDQKSINQNDAKKMLSFCSVSGPMFMIGTIGVMFLKSYKAGIIIFFANLISSLLNGLIYRGKKIQLSKTNYVSQNNNSLSDCVYDSIISILMVGGFIVLNFLLIDIILNLNILNIITSITNLLGLNSDAVKSTMIGMIEMTRGILDLSKTTIDIKLKTIIASGLIGFGGLSIFMQSSAFLKKLNISKKTMFFQKTTQMIITIFVTVLLVLIFS